MSDTGDNATEVPALEQNRVDLALCRQYIGKLRQNELLTAELYALFAQKIPQGRAFWETLIAEEKAHAEVLAGLEKLVQEGQAIFRRPDQFRLPDVMECIKWTESKIEQFAREGGSMSDALETALAVETTMVESKFFEVMDRDHPGMKQEFEELRQHTLEHVKRIKDEQGRGQRRLF